MSIFWWGTRHDTDTNMYEPYQYGPLAISTNHISYVSHLNEITTLYSLIPWRTESLNVQFATFSIATLFSVKLIMKNKKKEYWFIDFYMIIKFKFLHE